MAKRQVYQTDIWEEEAEADNPFATKSAYCHGYDVYGEILQKASWFEYLFLMFKGERPTEQQAALLEKLAIALANPGPREASVRAAMNGGVSKAAHASSLMCALAVGAGQYGGSHEVYLLVQAWRQNGKDVDAWKQTLCDYSIPEEADIWHPQEHALGFDPNIENMPTVTKNILSCLSEHSCDDSYLKWLEENRQNLEEIVGYSLSLSGIAAAVLVDLGFNEHASSMLYLMLRLPGAASHAIEQRDVGWKKFPFFADQISLSNDPGDMGLPETPGVSL